MSGYPEDRDRDLRESFQALRRAEAGQAPRFDPGRRPAKPSRTQVPIRLAWSAAAVLVVGGALGIALQARRPSASSIERAIAQARELQAWSASTDALLPGAGQGATQGGSGSGSRIAPDEPANQPTPSPD